MASSISGPTRLQPVYQPDRHTLHLFVHLPIRFLACLLRCFARERALSVGGSATTASRPPDLRSMTSLRDAHVIFVLLGHRGRCIWLDEASGWFWRAYTKGAGWKM